MFRKIQKHKYNSVYVSMSSSATPKKSSEITVFLRQPFIRTPDKHALSSSSESSPSTSSSQSSQSSKSNSSRKRKSSPKYSKTDVRRRLSVENENSASASSNNSPSKEAFDDLVRSNFQL
eukprot:962949_1